MTAQEKDLFYQLFEVPDQLKAEAHHMVTEQEIALILMMQKEEISAEELPKRILESKVSTKPEVLIESAYRRSIIDKTRQGEALYYQISNLYCRFPYYAQYEADRYQKFTKAQKDKLNQWDFELYLEGNTEGVLGKKAGNWGSGKASEFMTLEESDALIDQHQDLLYRIPCNCKCMMDVTEKPRDVCLMFDSGDNTMQDRGYGTPVTPEEAKALVRQWNKAGLMQNGEPDAICNCDGESCYPLQVSRALDAQGVYPKANYAIQWKEDQCIHCGKCAKICNFGAFQKGEDKKVTFDQPKCWGCTICVPNCPKDAISLIPLQK